MLCDHDALLAAICANPEEDTPRLMFADWLDENGDPERAEFIRLQCELAAFEEDNSGSFAMYAFLRERYRTGLDASDWTRIDAGVHRIIALERRAADLLRRHGEAWLPKLPKKCNVQWEGFHRGFAHHVTLSRSSKTMARHLLATVPPVTLTTASRFQKTSVRRLGELGLLGWLRGLDVRDDCTDGLREIGKWPEAATIRTLKVRWVSSLDVVEALADSPHWTGLQELDLSGTFTTTDAVEVLCRAPQLRTLKRLTIHGDGWPADTIREIANAGFTELTSLRLRYCGLDDDAAEILAACPHFANLRTLDLEGNSLTGRGVTALLTSRHLANLVYLELDDNTCTGVDAKRLATASPAALRLFHAHGCSFNTADVRALARCPRLRTLWYLDLDANDIGTPAVRELVRGFKNWCPPILWLTYNRIDDRGAELLANWKAATHLSALHLKYNRAMTSAGVRALLDSPHLANLDALGVETANKKLNARIRARFRHELGY
jgi:uncharacterized protein (TIGR02996 family)